MKKSSSIVILVIIVIIVAGGAFALMHKSNKKTSGTSSSGQSASQNNAPAVHNTVLITKTNSSLGQYLADPSGKALYTYGADTSGVSNCSGSCLAAWPAYVDTGSTANLPSGVSTFKRADNGQTQYAYNGMPLYYFASDDSGQVSGNGVDNFAVAKPAAASSSSSSSSVPSSSSAGSSNSASYPSY